MLTEGGDFYTLPVFDDPVRRSSNGSRATKFYYLFSRFDTTPASDRQTNRRISCDSIVRAMHAHRVAKPMLPGLYRWLKRAGAVFQAALNRAAF